MSDHGSGTLEASFGFGEGEGQTRLGEAHVSAQGYVSNSSAAWCISLSPSRMSDNNSRGEKLPLTESGTSSNVCQLGHARE